MKYWKNEWDKRFLNEAKQLSKMNSSVNVRAWSLPFIFKEETFYLKIYVRSLCFRGFLCVFYSILIQSLGRGKVPSQKVKRVFLYTRLIWTFY